MIFDPNIRTIIGFQDKKMGDIQNEQIPENLYPKAEIKVLGDFLSYAGCCFDKDDEEHKKAFSARLGFWIDKYQGRMVDPHQEMHTRNLLKKIVKEKN